MFSSTLTTARFSLHIAVLVADLEECAIIALATGHILLAERINSKDMLHITRDV